MDRFNQFSDSKSIIFQLQNAAFSDEPNSYQHQNQTLNHNPNHNAYSSHSEYQNYYTKNNEFHNFSQSEHNKLQLVKNSCHICNNGSLINQYRRIIKQLEDLHASCLENHSSTSIEHVKQLQTLNKNLTIQNNQLKNYVQSLKTFNPPAKVNINPNYKKVEPILKENCPSSYEAVYHLPQNKKYINQNYKMEVIPLKPNYHVTNKRQSSQSQRNRSLNNKSCQRPQFSIPTFPKY